MSYTPQKLSAAILMAPCIYCLAKPKHSCVTCTGNETASHMQRVHAGHMILIANGDHFCEKEHEARWFMGKSKGHTRENWEKNKDRLTARKHSR